MGSALMGRRGIRSLFLFRDDFPGGFLNALGGIVHLVFLIL